MSNYKSTNSLLASLAYLIVVITGLKAGSILIVPLLRNLSKTKILHNYGEICFYAIL